MKEKFTGHLGHVWSVHSNDGCETCDMVNKKKRLSGDSRENKI